MPLTVSHAAAVLPLHRRGKYELPLSALMIGSMAPDFGYFFSHDVSRTVTHSFPGLITFALPFGLVMWLFYVMVLEKATITLLPDRWHTRFAHTDAITPKLLARVCVAILLGGVTHILWDAFTHRSTFITDNVPALLAPTPGFPWLPIVLLLQGLSSVAGLVFLAIWARNLHRQPARSQIRPYDIPERARVIGLWILVAGAVLGLLVEWLPHARSHYETQVFFAFVGLMSGFFVAWCGVSVWMLLRARKRLTSSSSSD